MDRDYSVMTAFYSSTDVYQSKPPPEPTCWAEMVATAESLGDELNVFVVSSEW